MVITDSFKILPSLLETSFFFSLNTFHYEETIICQVEEKTCYALAVAVFNALQVARIST